MRRTASRAQTGQLIYFVSLVVDFVEQRHAVGLGPQSHLSGVAEGGVFDLEQLLAVVKHFEAVASEIDAEGKPLVGWDRNVDAVATRPTDNVKRAPDAAHSLVEHDVVLEGVGADHVIIVRISGTPDEAGRTVLGTGNGLELYLDEAILDVGVVLEKERISSPTGLLNYVRSRRRRLVLFNRPFGIASAGAGRYPAFGRRAYRIGLEADCDVCHDSCPHQGKKRGRGENYLHLAPLCQELGAVAKFRGRGAEALWAALEIETPTRPSRCDRPAAKLTAGMPPPDLFGIKPPKAVGSISQRHTARSRCAVS